MTAPAPVGAKHSYTEDVLHLLFFRYEQTAVAQNSPRGLTTSDMGLITGSC